MTASCSMKRAQKLVKTELLADSKKALPADPK